jgi:hypothetical protein
VWGGGVVDVVGVVVNDELDARDGEQGSSSQSPSGDLCGERGVAPRNCNQFLICITPGGLQSLWGFCGIDVCIGNTAAQISTV